jgi:tetratricopeptide (TPR) repeat protein/TolB-like protein
MGEDEAQMLKLLQVHSQFVKSAVEEHKGEIVQQIGDAFLIIFDSASEAVLCAYELQRVHYEYNLDKAEAEQILIRIGIHLGDIVFKDGDVFGDGVNVASRILPLAEPGGITVSRTVYDVVRKKMSLNAVSIGPQKLKNVDEKIEVFHLLTEVAGEKEVRKAQKKKLKEGKQFYFSVGLLSIILIIIIGLWINRTLSPEGIKGIFGIVKEAKVSVNSVAILPIRNITGNPQDNYFCEGISEDLIFRLSRVKEVYIHPLENVLALGTTSTTPKGIRNALGVKYLVLGSLQHTADSLSIQLEVFETGSGSRLFSKRYLAPDVERFNLLSEASQDILFQIVGRVSGEAKAALAAHSSLNVIANDLYLHARQAQRKAISYEDQLQVIRLYETAITTDGNFALARAYLATAYANCYNEWSKDTLYLVKSKQQAEKGIAIAPDLPEAYFALGKAMTTGDNYLEGEKAYNKALELRPDYREPRYALAELYWADGRLEESMALFKQLLELSREFGDRRDEAWALHNLGWRYHWLNKFDISKTQHENSLKIFREIGDRKGEVWALYNLGMINRKIGKYDKALKFNNDVLNITRQIGDRLLESYTLNELGLINDYHGDYDNALQFYTQSFEIAAETGNKHAQCVPLTNIGDVQHSLGEDSLALENQLNALKLARETKNPISEMWCLRYLAQIYLVLGDTTSSLKQYAFAFEILKEMDFSPARVFILTKYAKLMINQGKIIQAKDSLSTILGKVSLDESDRSAISIYLGECEVKLGETEKGLKRIKSVLDSLDIIQTYGVKVEGLYILGDLLIFLNRKSEASPVINKGREMALKAGMKGEVKRFDTLKCQMKNDY